MEVPLEFVDVVGGVAHLREQRVDDEATWPAMKDQFFFRSEWIWVLGAQGHAEMDDRSLLFVAEK